MTIFLAAWLTFDQVSCKFKNIEGMTPMPPLVHPCLEPAERTVYFNIHILDLKIICKSFLSRAGVGNLLGSKSHLKLHMLKCISFRAIQYF